MSFLEQRRGAHPAESRFRLKAGLRFAGTVRYTRHWPLLWSVVFFLFFETGWQLTGNLIGPAVWPTGAAAWAGRLAALTPLLWAVTAKGKCGFLCTAGVLAAICGMGFRCELAQRSAAAAASPWAPAVVHQLTVGTVLRATGWPEPRPEGRWRLPAMLAACPPDSGQLSPYWPRPGEGVLVNGTGDPPTPGELIRAVVRLRVPARATIPGGFDDAVYLAGKGLSWRGALHGPVQPAGGHDNARRTGLMEGCRRLRARLLERLESLLPRRESSLSGAVLLGARTPLSRTAAGPFSGLGLAHLFALSGLHVGLLLGMVLGPARLLHLSDTVKFSFGAALLPLYGVLTGAPSSVVRAAGLALLALAAPCLGSRNDPVRHLCLLFWGAVLWSPAVVLDVGARLSFLAAGGILVISSVSDGLRWGLRGWRSKVAGGISVSLAAQWFTLPVIAASFGWVNLWSPLANLFAVPAFGLTVGITVASLGLSFLWSWAAEAVSAYGVVGWRILQAGVIPLAETLSRGQVGLRSPSLTDWWVWFGLTVLLLAVLNGRSRIRHPLVAAAVIGTGGLGWLASVGPGFRAGAGPQAWQLDVGQGDCALVTFPDRWTCLIDTAGRLGYGPDSPSVLSRQVLPFLQRLGIRDLDAVVLTHGHADHTAGAAELARTPGVSRWFVSGRAGRGLTGAADSTLVARLCAGTVLHRWRSWTLEVWYPPQLVPSGLSENDHSMVLALCRNDRTAIVWSGDLEHEGEAALLAGGHLGGAAQVWKAGHHGSDTSGSRTFLTALAPDLVLVSVGAGNRHGHPSHGPYTVRGDTLPILRTDLHGSIRLTWSADGRYQVKCFNNGSLRAPGLDTGEFHF